MNADKHELQEILRSLEEIENDKIKLQAHQLLLMLNPELSSSLNSNRSFGNILDISEEQLNQRLIHLNQIIEEKTKKLSDIRDETQSLNIIIQQHNIPHSIRNMTLKELTDHCIKLKNIMEDFLTELGDYKNV
ncbi:uncharacterized protein CMU_001600 [Cryptosporidium muris RN66]|uniref:Uncharacterized protein n=1 Tax=Cryptosporidium muris (strain RN66) TaxID=441375 RepID=B6AGE8_CRYMR|nr:uncharacterized protein CMU_001600 [Cryptosporidium muris RN66]EEA07289.1 hypothetical protein, conserved [Cryptosporidium muris RN66]|eukprot:XP_002141638.1 hypothetical protein [Cryptosporidium muris RN66]